MDTTKFEEVFEKMNRKMEFVPENLKEEMINEIISDIEDTVNFYYDPQTICMEMLYEKKYDNEVMDKIFEYFTDGCWFCVKPKLVENDIDIYDFIDSLPHDQENINWFIVRVSDILGEIRRYKIDISKNFYLALDGSDDIVVKEEIEFLDWFIDGLEEEGRLNGNVMNKIFIDLIRIMRG